MPRSVAIDELADLLGVVRHPDRVRIIQELRHREQDVNSLMDALEVSHSRVSQHLSVLRSHRIVQRRKSGRRAFYSLVNPRIAPWLLAGLDFVESGIRHDAALQLAVDVARSQFSDA